MYRKSGKHLRFLFQISRGNHPSSSLEYYEKTTVSSSFRYYEEFVSRQLNKDHCCPNSGRIHGTPTKIFYRMHHKAKIFWGRVAVKAQRFWSCSRNGQLIPLKKTNFEKLVSSCKPGISKTHKQTHFRVVQMCRKRFWQNKKTLAKLV